MVLLSSKDREILAQAHAYLEKLRNGSLPLPSFTMLPAWDVVLEDAKASSIAEEVSNYIQSPYEEIVPGTRTPPSSSLPSLAFPGSIANLSGTTLHNNDGPHTFRDPSLVSRYLYDADPYVKGEGEGEGEVEVEVEDREEEDQYIPLVDLWLDIKEHFPQSINIPSPVGIGKRKNASK
ncbi:hypothetical protein C8Q80DRAFT_1265310 [Daedaleopsis nitida]|nr:hypothetical protein C8Q80DRAFT_1265310 [Daedaleopsis nitida]